MKKVFKILVLGLFIALGSCSEEATDDRQITNKIEAKTLKDFYSKYGSSYSITDFNSQNQTSITLPKGSTLEIPYGAFTIDGNEPYLGKVKIYSREFTSVSDLAMSNFQALDIDNNLLITGGSFELLFVDENYKKLYLNENKTIKMKFPAKIESDYMNEMKVWNGNYEKKSITNRDSRELLYWSLKQDASVNLNDKFYEYIITPKEVNGDDNLVKRPLPPRQLCDSMLLGSDEWLRCMGIIVRNWDIAFWDAGSVNFGVDILGDFNPEYAIEKKFILALENPTA